MLFVPCRPADRFVENKKKKTNRNSASTPLSAICKIPYISFMVYHPASKKIVMGAIAIIAWFAVIAQFYLILQTTTQTGFSTSKTIINFFSYFTILNNLLVAVCLTSSLSSPSSKWGSFFSKATVQSAIALYIFIVGLVYNLVLRGIVSVTGLDWVVDNLLHVVVPVLFVLYWFIYTARGVLQWKNIFPWLFFPVFYLIYSLIRGAVTGWYAYPFIHAAKLGYRKVVINCFFVAFAFFGVGLLFIMINRYKKKPGR